MVKNTVGGNKAKKQARNKNAGISPMTQTVRYVKELGEMYAIITKIYGGKTCQVMCDDGVSRRCTIRRKFTTARRGENMLGLGTWLMVGLYDWEKRADGTQTCDILEVYSTGEKEKLKQTVPAKQLKNIVTINNEQDGNKHNSEVNFSEMLGKDAEWDEGDGEEDGDEDDEGGDGDEDDEGGDDDKAKELLAVIPLKNIPVVKGQSATAQTDWLNIDADDI